MSDFHQQGSITTLHNLTRERRSFKEELLRFSKNSPIFLVLPCHASDLFSPAIPRILEGIRGADYLTEVVISMNGLPAARFGEAREIWSGANRPVTLLFNDSPEASEILGSRANLRSLPHGKGLNIWAAILNLSDRYSDGVVAFHDCDILSYEPHLLEHLVYPAAHPDFDGLFIKGYYSRVKGRLYGRVTRLFLIPFLRAIIRVAGHHPLLDFLDCFRYPLAGEFAGRLGELSKLPVSGGWGLEIAMLCECFRRIPPTRMIQVDLGIEYDHKHQPLQSDSGGLARMCREIAIELLSQLKREGVVLDLTVRAALKTAYAKLAEETIRRYSLDAEFNALEFDEKREKEAVGVFRECLDGALEGLHIAVDQRLPGR